MIVADESKMAKLMDKISRLFADEEQGNTPFTYESGEYKSKKWASQTMEILKTASEAHPHVTSLIEILIRSYKSQDDPESQKQAKIWTRKFRELDPYHAKPSRMFMGQVPFD
jgi:hypothetical protein